MRKTLRLLAPLLVGGCLMLDSSAISIEYALQPQHFPQDFGALMGTVKDIPCASDAVCAVIPLPAVANGKAQAKCDAGKCAIHADVTIVQTIDLSKEQSFPSSVANSSVVNAVVVNAVRFWAPTNTLSFDTPPIDLFVGSTAVNADTDPGAQRMGTVPVIPQGQTTAQASPKNVTLTEAGKGALATFAKSFRTPFHVLAVAHVVVAAGQPVPAGKIDLYVQPVVAFKIPLK
ncbi:MAG: hypothetical protein EXR72_06305 [Myxococcales bacterium]|nr:hypothetical protein [Myxococcales bacterium]